MFYTCASIALCVHACTHAIIKIANQQSEPLHVESTRGPIRQYNHNSRRRPGVVSFQGVRMHNTHFLVLDRECLRSDHREETLPHVKFEHSR